VATLLRRTFLINKVAMKMKTSHIFVKSLVWILFFLVFSFVPSNVEASGTVVRVDPQTVTRQIGETFNVSIKIDDVQTLYGIDVLLRWDASILEATAATAHLGVEDYPDGVLHKTVLNMTNQLNQGSGEYHVLASSLNPAGSFNGSGTVAVITFSVKDNGSCSLSLASTILAKKPAAGETATAIDYTRVDGYFTTNSTPTTPQSTGFDWNSLAISAIVIIIIVVVVVVALYFKKEQEPENDDYSDKLQKRKKSKDS
jgi:hypothetical protein